MFEDALAEYQQAIRRYDEACSGDVAAQSVIQVMQDACRGLGAMAQDVASIGNRIRMRVEEQEGRASVRGRDGLRKGKNTEGGDMGDSTVNGGMGFSDGGPMKKGAVEDLERKIGALDEASSRMSELTSAISNAKKVNGLSSLAADISELDAKKDEVGRFAKRARKSEKDLKAFVSCVKEMPDGVREELRGKIKQSDAKSVSEESDRALRDKAERQGKEAGALLSKVRDKAAEAEAFVSAAAALSSSFGKIVGACRSKGILEAADVKKMKGFKDFKDKLHSACSMLTSEAESIATELSEGSKATGKLTSEDANLGKIFPSLIRFGQKTYALDDINFSVSLPELKRFPFDGDILFKRQGDIAPLLLHLAYVLPVGQCELVSVDTESFGEHVRDISALHDVPRLFRMINQAENGRDDGVPSCESLVQDLSGEMDRIVRDRQFSHDAPDWKSYVKRGKGRAIPYRAIVVFSLEGIDTRLASELVRVARKASDFGMQFYWSVHVFDNSDEQVASILRKYRKETTFVEYPQPKTEEDAGFDNVTVQVVPDTAPLPATMARLASQLVDAQRNKPKPKARTFTDLFGESKVWNGDATYGFDVTIGWNDDGEPVRFLLGDSKKALYYALLGGATGSGKSNLLHVIIHSMCREYSPEELELYLLDFKDGLEFQKYAKGGKAWLPHARCITTHNNPDYALSLFKFLEGEFRRRKKLYHGLSKYEDYRNSGKRLPRMVVIIDEFHKIFEGPNGDAITDALTNILKQGRAYGIHLILATQTLSNLSVLGLPQMLQQIPIRISLKGTGEERILADDNFAASELVVGQGIRNNSYGAKEANEKFSLPYIDYRSEAEADFQEEIGKAVKSSGTDIRCRIFNGSKLPPQPGEIGECISGATEDVVFSLALGLENDFEGSPFVVRCKKYPGENMIVTGEAGELDAGGDVTGEEVWNGFMSSCINSLMFQKVPTLYYNPQKVRRPESLPEDVRFVPGNTDPTSFCEALKEFIGSGDCPHVMLVENYELARLLIPGRTGGFVEPGSLLSVFNKAFEWEKPLYLILFMHNYAFVSKNMFGYDSDIKVLDGCTKRIGFHVDEETMAALSPRSAKLQIEGSVIYEDIDEPEKARTFLPYSDSV